MASTIPDGSSWIRELIVDFVGSPENTLKNPENDPAWAEPIIGFSSGGDPLYKFYKEDIGGFYLTPLEFFTNEYPNTKATADQLTIISWILPQTEATKTDHRKEKYFPCERWARSRIYGEEYNDKLRAHIVQELKQARIQAVAPVLSPSSKAKSQRRMASPPHGQKDTLPMHLALAPSAYLTASSHLSAKQCDADQSSPGSPFHRPPDHTTTITPTASSTQMEPAENALNAAL